MSLVTVSKHLWKKLNGPDEAWAHNFTGSLFVVAGEAEAVEAVEAELHAATERGEPDDRHGPDNYTVRPPVKIRVDGARGGVPSVADGTDVWPVQTSRGRNAEMEFITALSAGHPGAVITFFARIDQCHTVQIAERGELRQETAGTVDYTWARGTRGQLVHPSATAKTQDGPMFRLKGNRHTASGVELVEITQ